MLKADSGKKAIASVLVILQCLIFGLGFIAVRELLDKGFPTFLLLCIRFGMGTFFLLCIGLLFRYSPKLTSTIGAIGHFSKRDIAGGLISGCILFAAFTSQTFGAGITTPAKNGLLTDLFVIFVPIISMVLMKKFSLQPIIYAVISFIGVAFIMDIFSNSGSVNWGDGLSIVCGLLFAVQFIIMEKYAAPNKESSPVNSFNFTVVQLAVMAGLSLILSLITETSAYSSIQWGHSIGWLIFLGIFGSAMAYLFQFFAQSIISAEATSVLSCSEAIFTVIFSLIFGYDKFSWRLGVGAAIIIIAMILISIPLKLPRKTEATNEEKK